MQLKLLFWLAVISAVMGMHSPDGNLFYFFAAHLTALMVGISLRRREKRGRVGPSKRLAARPPSAAGPKRKTV